MYRLQRVFLHKIGDYWPGFGLNTFQQVKLIPLNNVTDFPFVYLTNILVDHKNLIIGYIIKSSNNRLTLIINSHRIGGL